VNAADPLAGLRDIHLPEAVSWWPPAPGWWGLLLLLVLTIGLLLWWRKHRRDAAAKPVVFSHHEQVQAAQSELDGIAQRVQAGGLSQGEFAAELSALLRRVAMLLDANAAGLSGDAWLVWLDDRWDESRFCSDVGRQWQEAAYNPDSRIDPQALIELARDWLRAQ